MTRIILFFLIFIVIMAMFGRWKTRFKLPRRLRRRVADAQKCRDCGAYLIGEKPCVCGNSS